MSDGTVEYQLLELVRGEDDIDFTLTIMNSDGKWTISYVNLNKPEAQWRGTGETFEEAWNAGENSLLGR